MDGNETSYIDDGYVLFEQEELFGESFPLMREIRRMGFLCDVTLKVLHSVVTKKILADSVIFQIEDQSFSAHRIVLAGTIPYFYAMFTNNMTEARVKEIEMKEIEPQ